MMRALIVLTALAVAAPAVSHAQDAFERRRQQAAENLRQLDQNQRIGEVERQLNNIEIRRQSDESLRALQAPTPVAAIPYVVPGSSVATGVSPVAPLILPAGTLRPGVSAEDRLRDLELAASNLRLREISAAQRGQ